MVGLQWNVRTSHTHGADEASTYAAVLLVLRQCVEGLQSCFLRLRVFFIYIFLVGRDPKNDESTVSAPKHRAPSGHFSQLYSYPAVQAASAPFRVN